MNDTDVALFAIRHATKSVSGDEVTLSDTKLVHPIGVTGPFLLALTATSRRMSPTAVPSGIDNETGELFIDVPNAPN